MKTRCEYCHTYRVEEDGARHLENEDGFPCMECEDWLEEEDWEEEDDDGIL